MTSLNPVFTIGQQIAQNLMIHQKLGKAQARTRTIDLLKLVGIPHGEGRFNDYPHQFSGGMRQRVLIAAAIACQPDVLIADEPTTALDVTIQAQILQLLIDIQQPARQRDDLHHSRSRRSGRVGRSCARHVCRPDGRIRGRVDNL